MDNKEKSKQLISWFKERDFPAELTVGRYIKFVNLERYIQTAVTTMENSESNSAHWRAAYYRLFYLKKQIEKNNELLTPSTNSKTYERTVIQRKETTLQVYRLQKGVCQKPAQVD